MGANYTQRAKRFERQVQKAEQQKRVEACEHKVNTASGDVARFKASAELQREKAKLAKVKRALRRRKRD